MPENYRGKHVLSDRRHVLFWAVGAAVVLALAAAAIFFIFADGPGGKLPAGPSSSSAGSDSSGSASSSAGSASSSAGPVSSAGGQDSSSPGSGASSGAQSAPRQPDEDIPYDFTQPAPQAEAVENSYFDDAAFVGDSRTDGFMLYSGIGTGRNLTSNGLSIFKLAEKKALKIGGKKYTLLEALALEEYGKVYLSLGVNELGVYNDEGFYTSYCAAIDAIRAVQPKAVIYIQGLIPLNEKQIEEYNGNKYNLTNEHLRIYNDLMRRVAEEKQVVYLDLYTEFADENGSLPEGVSRDGVHLVKDACRQWLDYLKTHTVEFDRLYPDGLPGADTGPEQPDTSTEDGSVQG